MKRMADALGTLGELVLDHTLVLNVLRGLNDRYSHLAAMITHSCLFPSFSDVRANLLIEEVTMASKVSGHAIPQGVVQITPVANDHGMVTRGKHGFREPRTIMNLQAITLSPIPKAYRGALADPNWHDAMQEEFTALQANKTWDLVPPPPSINIVTGKGFFDTNYIRMAPSTVTKLDGSFVVLPNAPVLILVKLSVLLLSQPPYAQCSLWLSLRIGLSIN
jgi:hypothetical protein